MVGKITSFSMIFLLCAGVFTVGYAGPVNFKCACQQSFVDSVNSIATDEAIYTCSAKQIRADNYDKEMNMSEKHGKVELQGKMITLLPGQTDIELRFAPRDGAIMTSILDVTDNFKEEWSGSYKDGDWKTVNDFKLEDVKNAKGVVFMKSSVAGFGGARDGGKKWDYAASVLYFLHGDGQYKAAAVCIENK